MNLQLLKHFEIYFKKCIIKKSNIFFNILNFNVLLKLEKNGSLQRSHLSLYFQVWNLILISSSFEFEQKIKRQQESFLNPSPWKPEVNASECWERLTEWDTESVSSLETRRTCRSRNSPTMHLRWPLKLSPLSVAAYNFGFDASTAHADLKVQGNTVTWEPQGVKGHDPRLRGKENKSRWGNAEYVSGKQRKTAGGSWNINKKTYSLIIVIKH